MSRTWSVIKREFLETISTRAFLIGTITTPLLIIGGFALQIFLASRTGGGERQIVIVDLSEHEVGGAVADLLGAGNGEGRTRFTIEFAELDPAGEEATRTELLDRVDRDEIDGFLWIPADVMTGGTVSYDGENASSLLDMERIKGGVQTAVQGARLANAGIDPTAVTDALSRVPFDARKTGGRAASGSTSALMGLTYILGLAIYMMVILYGAAVLRGVLEEKRDRIVEVVISSIRADQLMIGKVLGIGGAGVFQVSIWAAFAGLALSQGNEVAMRFGAPLPELPDVPITVGLIFLYFFATGFLLYATLYAAVGAIATTDQEAQQLQTPLMMLLVAGIMLMMPVMMDPAGKVAVIGSIVPFTAPIVMPMRAAVVGIPPLQLVGSMALILLSLMALIWVAARIYRIGILSTGKRPALHEVWQWIRVG